MSVYYNEFDAKTAAWLRELIKQGLIADGEVDERSILEVQPDDVKGFAQCHFFAGIGGWSYALRLAGWFDDRFVWTGSPPCQPFSAAGQQAGAADERHLWPKYFSLIRECAPPVVFGEQVAAAISGGWLDAVFADMEGEGYACAAAVLPACSVGAPHIRQRLWFVANAQSSDRQIQLQPRRQGQSVSESGGSGGTGVMADSTSRRQRELRSAQREAGFVDEREPVSGMAESKSQQHNGSGHTRRGRRELADGGVVEHTGSERLQARNGQELRKSRRREERRKAISASLHWHECEWLNCADGKARPTKPGIFPLAYGIPGRMGSLRGAGNAIVPQCAQAFIESYLSIAG